MQELIDRIVTATGLPQEKATKALGIVLNLLQTQGNQQKVGELFDKLPVRPRWRDIMERMVRPRAADCWACWPAA